MSVVDVDTTAAAPEANDAPENRPLGNVPESHNNDRGVQPQRLSGWRLQWHDADLRLRLGHLSQKAAAVLGAVAEHLYMACDVGMVRPKLRHLSEKAGAVLASLAAVAEHLYMGCDVGMVRMVSILVVICIFLYCLYGAIIYALRDQDMVY